MLRSIASSRFARQAGTKRSYEAGIPVEVFETSSQRAAGRNAVTMSDGQRNIFLRSILWLWNKSRIATIATACLIIAVIVVGCDSLLTMGRIYDGVRVGNIDLSGKTVEEATQLISQEYEPRITSNTITFFANEADAQGNDEGSERPRSLDEQISYEESLSKRDRWTTDSEHVGATFDPLECATMAFEVGRNDGGLINRIKAYFAGIDITPVCSFNETSVSEMRDEMIEALGYKMVDFNVKMEDGYAQVTEGNDGYEVSQEWIVEKLNEGFLNREGDSSFVIDMHDVPIRIDRGTAQQTAREIDASIDKGIDFVYEGSWWSADRKTLASWIVTDIEQYEDDYALVPLFDIDEADSAIIKGFQYAYNGSGYTVSFSEQDDQIIVQTDATGSVPQVKAAIEELNDTFFSENEHESPTEVEVISAQIPASMTLDEALDYGLVRKIDSFTTKYASGAKTRNTNIHIAADALNNSICKAGETWSFLALSGETTPEKGYQDAGAIISGEYSDAVGGGICQVATTVFNAVYEAGYPIEKRYNHSLYIASYPEGRDAAIAYPDMDLIWRNDTDSDVLLVMSYTNASVTATLYGVDPGYEVSTSYGEWQEGDPYKTIVRQDPDYPVGKEFVETTGADGRAITIVRTVKDANGVVISEDTFSSSYKPKNEIIVKGSAPVEDPKE